MSQREYLWCGDASFANQTNEDVITRLTTPPEVRLGRFGLSFAQQSGVGDSGGGHVHTLLSMAGSPLALEIRLEPVAILSSTRGTSKITVRAGGSLLVTSPTFTHTEGNAIDLSFDGAAGRVSIQRGHEESPTDTYGTAWDVADAAMTHGGAHGSTGQSARGNVSLPYVVKPAGTPISIYGSACTAWYNLDSRVMATPPNIETLTNLANTSNANITQGTDAQRPHLIDIGGKNYADFAADQNLNNLAVVTDLFPVAAPAVTAYFVGRFDAFTNTNTIFDFGTTLSQTGIAFASRTAGIRIIVHAGAVQSIFDHVYSDTGLHFFEVRYDGTNVTLYIDSVQVNQFAKTGTMTNACDAVSVGQHTQGGNQFNGAMRDIVLVNGTPTAEQRALANTWGMAQI